MTRTNKRRLLIAMAAIFVILFSACVFVLIKGGEKHFLSSAEIISSQISTLIQSNESEKNELQASLKEEYISRARALAYILEKDDSLQADYDELCKVADLLSIDEVNVFGTDGLIAYSTVPDYVGFSIYSGGQIAFFEPMMADHSLALCQDLTPNTKEAKLIMYAAVWRSDGDSIVQIGITPERLLASMEEKDISKVLDKMPLENTMYFIYDTAQDRIVSSTEPRLFGLADRDTLIELNVPANTAERLTVEGTKYVYTMADFDQYRIGVCEYAQHLYRDARTNGLVLFVFLAAALAGIFLLINIMTRHEKENEQKYVSELQDFADQLSNYKRAILSDALISLEVNLTKDDLYYGVWKDDAGAVVPLKDIIGLETPCSYDKYIHIWNERFVKRDNTGAFSGRTDRMHLLELFGQGSTEITFDYEAKTISGRSTWLRRIISMTKNQSGDVVAYTSVKDISALVEQTKREEAYVRALATEYGSISIVSIEQNKNDDKVLLHSRVSEDIAALIDEETVTEENYSRKLVLLLRFIHPDDQAAFVENTRREQILDAFTEDKTYVVDFRIMKPADSYLYYQIRFVPLRDDGGALIGMIACLPLITRSAGNSASGRRWRMRRSLPKPPIRPSPPSSSICPMISVPP